MNNARLVVDCDAIEGLAMGTAVLRLGFDVDTDIDEIEESDWEELIQLANDYCSWVGHKKAKLTKQDFMYSVWNLEIEE